MYIHVYHSYYYPYTSIYVVEYPLIYVWVVKAGGNNGDKVVEVGVLDTQPYLYLSTV